MSNTNTCEKNMDSKATSTTETHSDSFVAQLQQILNDTDSFLKNISEKWLRDHPELAKQWQDILKNSEINDTNQDDS